MEKNIKFHCDSENNFKSNQQMKTIVYKDYEVEKHNHDFYEMNIILKGKGIHKIEDSSFEVKLGDVFVIPPMTAHSYYDTDNLDVYHILLHKNFVRSNWQEAANVPGFLQLMEIEPFLRLNFSDGMFLNLSHNQLLQVQNDLSFFDEGGEYANEEFAPMKEHLMWKIIYWLSYLLFKQMNMKEKKTTNKYQYAIIQVLEYMHQNFGEKISVEDLAEKAYLSRSTFLRSFYSICGCTPMKYLNEYRCKKAMEMMNNEDWSKTDIAHICGFYDLSHMEKNLKGKQY